MNSCRSAQLFKQLIEVIFLMRGIVFVAHSNIFVSNVVK